MAKEGLAMLRLASAVFIRRVMRSSSVAVTLLFFTTSAEPAIMYTVSFDDPSAAFAPFYSGITTSLLAAGQDWASVLVGTGTIDVEVGFSASVPTANAASLTTVF